MTTVATEYDLSTGEFGMTMIADGENACELNQRDGMGWVEGVWKSDTHYVVNGQPTARPASPVTIDGMTLMNIPAGSTVLLDGQSYPAEGDVELEFPLPGTYQLRVIAWPHKDWEGEVVVP